MTSKRRNGERNKHGRGHVRLIRCSNCGNFCPKDKAIKQFLVKNVVEQVAVCDVQEASAYDSKAICEDAVLRLQRDPLSYDSCEVSHRLSQL
uniref:40S ribosomal protein S26 n=1 Tax=Nelumbo nucifera TaxID=4432 RepID=A0A822YQJ4_NELNU|nr:TPA_asm: hypothetical protein HUJ06_005470 [Nelumbo nucifera]